ncbi:MAG: response regulator [Proteobacteria bacterium]|nr:response regulator [Pseudomonadota bacterium]MBI3498065.1 response regulator [Pseudomonadota bacterium]
MGVAVGSIRVLLIDDNDFMRETVASMLRDIGFRDISQARDGDDALRQLKQANPGLIICDIAMQPMDGLQFVEALRKHSWPRAAEIPVILLTVHTEAPIVKQAVKLGVEAYVVKPVQRKELEARVVTVLENALVRRR